MNFIFIFNCLYKCKCILPIFNLPKKTKKKITYLLIKPKQVINFAVGNRFANFRENSLGEPLLHVH